MRVRGKFAADKEHGKNAKVTFTILDSKDKVISRSEARANAECIVDTVTSTAIAPILSFGGVNYDFLL